MLHEHIELFKRPMVEQKLNPLSRRQLAALVLCVNARLPAAKTGIGAAVFEGV
jgi:hypothetical protein